MKVAVRASISVWVQNIKCASTGYGRGRGLVHCLLMSQHSLFLHYLTSAITINSLMYNHHLWMGFSSECLHSVCKVTSCPDWRTISFHVPVCQLQSSSHHLLAIPSLRAGLFSLWIPRWGYTHTHIAIRMSYANENMECFQFPKDDSAECTDSWRCYHWRWFSIFYLSRFYPQIPALILFHPCLVGFGFSCLFLCLSVLLFPLPEVSVVSSFVCLSSLLKLWAPIQNPLISALMHRDSSNLLAYKQPYKQPYKTILSAKHLCAFNAL